MKKQVFISYRREGGQFFGKIIHDELVKRGYSVFFDVESIESGTFDTQIYNIIDECTDFVLILSPGALDRCFNDDDWVANEIRYAISRGKNIIPIMLKNFEWPEKLPEGMEKLPLYEGDTFTNNANSEYINASIDVLCNKLLKSRSVRKIRKSVFIALAVILAAAVILGSIKAMIDVKQIADSLGNGSASEESEEAEKVKPGSAGTDHPEDYLHSFFQDGVINQKMVNEICFLYDDYDNDGCHEAFAVTGDLAEYKHGDTDCYENVTIYFIDSDGKVTLASEPGSGYFGCEEYGDERILDTGSDKFLLWEWYAGGIYSISYIFGVRNGDFRTPKCNQHYYGFHFDTDHYEAYLDYPEYAHDSDLFWMMYDETAGEFNTIARTFREDADKQLRSLNTASGLIVQDGSIVNIDYVESYDGRTADLLGTAGGGVDVIVGSGTSVGDFEEQLIGHKVGETFTISVLVPDDYMNEEMAGKEVEFEITIRGIYK